MTGKPGESPSSGWAGWDRRLYLGCLAALLALAAASGVAAQQMRGDRAVTTNMEPSVLLGEAVLIDIEYYRTREPSRGDVVRLRRSSDNLEQLDRIIGLPGDRVQMRGGQL